MCMFSTDIKQHSVTWFIWSGKIKKKYSFTGSFLEVLDFSYFGCSCRLQLLRKVLVCAPLQIRKQLVGQLHALCKAAMMRMNPSTAEKPMAIPIFIIFWKGGFSIILEGICLKIVPRGKPPDSHFLSSPVSYCNTWSMTIAMPSLYGLSCYWPAFH